MTTTGKVQIVLAVELQRQQDAAVSALASAARRRLMRRLQRGACGVTSDSVEDWPPTDCEFCPRCEELYQADYQRRLGKIYRLAVAAAERSAGQARPPRQQMRGRQPVDARLLQAVQ